MTTIGVLGGPWRATVSPGGTIAQWDGLPALSWYVAADDRWHVPENEVTVRQTRVDGTPVVETRVRVPTGDAVQRVYAVADGGGMTIVRVENDSTLPIAVAFSGPPLLSPRPPADAPIAGIELPAGAVMFPVGHHATLTVAIPHDGRPAGALGSLWPSVAQVSRGWLAVVERAGRLDLPDAAHVAEVVHARCELLLEGPELPADDPVGFLLGAELIVRMSGDPAHWVPEVADAVQRTLRLADAWDARAALDAAARVLAAAGERRASSDLARHRRGASPDQPTLPSVWPDGVRGPAWAERRIVSNGVMFPAGIPSAWWGQHLEVHGLPAGPASTVSFALRWHGARPAVLWEVTGEPVTLSSPSIAPGWSTSEPTGEALWPAPVDRGGSAIMPGSALSAPSDAISFS